jgi:exodeoxyribonuclease V alpha subunit
MPPLDNPPKGTRGDFYFYNIDDPARAADFIRSLVVQHIPAFFGHSAMEEIQVLVPLHRGECGTTALNAALQEALNPPAPHKAEFKVGREPERIFRVGDRIMQTKNNYKKGVCNGECGIIARINPEQRSFTVAFDNMNVEYSVKECDQLLHSYAVTVHKSQGSEFPVVIMPMLSQHHIMLQRNLLYTGITRARKLMIIVGTTGAVATAVRNNTPTRRCSLLKFRLKSGQR